MELYCCNGRYRISCSYLANDSEVRECVIKVFEKSKTFRYRETTLQDRSRACYFCRHLTFEEHIDDKDGGEFNEYHCGFFLREAISLDNKKQTHVQLTDVACVDRDKGTCDAYLAHEQVINAWESRNQEYSQDILWELRGAAWIS